MSKEFTHNENIFNSTLIINRLMEVYKFRTKSEFAEYLGIKPQTLSSWESRNSIDYALIYAKCENINGDWLLSGEGSVLKLEDEEDPYSMHQKNVKELQEKKYSDDFVEQLLKDHERLIATHEKVTDSLCRVTDSHQKLTDTHFMLAKEITESKKDKRERKLYTQKQTMSQVAEPDVEYKKNKS